MYAIVNIAGKQIKVSKDQKIVTPKIDAEAGSTVEFDEVMLLEDAGKVKVGTPTVKNTKVSAKVVGHGKGDTVIVFKKKRRKGYRKKNGHRQAFSTLLIESIS
ncbi:MAG: 50S ribosomal protein L21 [Cyclobacteriaceae bacterium]|nr:50S ribosomal protein L21 [Cyclobacteriaceae bacterium]